jgi:hypothetical protein
MKQSIIIHKTSTEFFWRELKEALKHKDLPLPTELEHYLVHLLSSYTNNIPVNLDQPLAFLYYRAIESDKHQRTQLYKSMGDSSLYLAGFFKGFFKRKTYDETYFIAMGKSAYYNLALEVNKKNKAKSDVYEKLSTSFSDLVDTFALLSERLCISTKPAIIEEFERCHKLDYHCHLSS